MTPALSPQSFAEWIGYIYGDPEAKARVVERILRNGVVNAAQATFDLTGQHREALSLLERAPHGSMASVERLLLVALANEAPIEIVHEEQQTPRLSIMATFDAEGTMKLALLCGCPLAISSGDDGGRSSDEGS